MNDEPSMEGGERPATSRRPLNLAAVRLGDYGDPVKNELASLPVNEFEAILEDENDPRHQDAREMSAELLEPFKAIDSLCVPAGFEAQWAFAANLPAMSKLLQFTSTMSPAFENAELKATILKAFGGADLTRRIQEQALGSSFSEFAQARMAANSFSALQDVIGRRAYAPHVSSLGKRLADTFDDSDWQGLAASASAIPDTSAKPTDPESVQIIQNINIYIYQPTIDEREKSSRAATLLLWVVAAYATIFAERSVPDRDELLHHLYAVLWAMKAWVS